VNEGDNSPVVLASHADPPTGPWMENPPWSGFDLLLLTGVVVFGIFFFTAISVGVLHGIYGQPLSELAGNPSVWMVVPAEGAAYVLMFAVLYWLAGSRHLRFWHSAELELASGVWLGGISTGWVCLSICGGTVAKDSAVAERTSHRKAVSATRSAAGARVVWSSGRALRGGDVFSAACYIR